MLPRGLIRGYLQARRAVAHVAEQPPSPMPTSLPVRTKTRRLAPADVHAAKAPPFRPRGQPGLARIQLAPAPASAAKEGSRCGGHHDARSSRGWRCARLATSGCVATRGSIPAFVRRGHGSDHDSVIACVGDRSVSTADRILVPYSFRQRWTATEAGSRSRSS